MQLVTLEGHLYDEEGNEVIIPEGCCVVYSNGTRYFVETYKYDANLVYRPERLNPETPKGDAIV